MLALLPPVCCALAALIVRRRFRREWREALLAAAVFTGVFAAMLAELAGAAHLFGRAFVTGGWALLALLLAGAWRQTRHRALGPADLGAGLENADKALLAGLGLLAAGVALIAWAAAPNNWDSMTYRAFSTGSRTEAFLTTRRT